MRNQFSSIAPRFVPKLFSINQPAGTLAASGKNYLVLQQVFSTYIKFKLFNFLFCWFSRWLLRRRLLGYVDVLELKKQKKFCQCIERLILVIQDLQVSLKLKSDQPKVFTVRLLMINYSVKSEKSDSELIHQGPSSEMHWFRMGQPCTALLY